MTNKNYDSEQEYHGLGMASPSHDHRDLQRKITGNFQKKTSWKESLKLQYEQAVDGPDDREIEPDISYWGTRKPRRGKKGVKLDDLLLVIEIVHSKNNWDYSYLRILDAFNFKETMQEGFIYNYENGKWWRFRKANNGSIRMEEGKDYSSVLRLYLHTLVKE